MGGGGWARGPSCQAENKASMKSMILSVCVGNHNYPFAVNFLECWTQSLPYFVTVLYRANNIFIPIN